MEIWVPDEDQDSDPRWWEPLERVAERVHTSRTLPTILPCEFMFMGRADRAGRPSIWLYKHYDTRSYLNLDDRCRAYRYIPPRDLMGDEPGRYVPHRGLRPALLHLELSMLTPEQRVDLARCDRCRELAEDLVPRDSYSSSDSR